MDIARLRASIDRQWREEILEPLKQYVRIPSKSPAFDPDWERNGYMEAATQLMADWCRRQAVPGMRVDIRRLPGLTPVLIVDVPGDAPGCALLYGHLDKQPEFPGWLPGLGPWEPVERDGKLYGRGSADDGYAVFSALAAIVALKEQAIPLARCIILIEASEESGSTHLPPYLEALGETLGTPSLVICLDSECGNYEQLWCANSVRGVMDGVLRVRVLSEGVHSGLGSGIAPTPFRIIEQLLARIEDPSTGELLPEALKANIPAERRDQMKAAAPLLGAALTAKLPFVEGARPVDDDPEQLLINNTWRASLVVIGADGLPPSERAGNVLLPEISLRLSFRLAPTSDPERAAAAVKRTLEYDPPYGTDVTFTVREAIGGWDAIPLAPWLNQSLARASQRIFGKDVVHVGCGGTLPLFRMLRGRFPDAQFFVTGVLGPQSNAHGPNEFLHLDYVRSVTACVAMVLADHATALVTDVAAPAQGAIR